MKHHLERDQTRFGATAAEKQNILNFPIKNFFCFLNFNLQLQSVKKENVEGDPVSGFYRKFLKQKVDQGGKTQISAACFYRVRVKVRVRDSQ